MWQKRLWILLPALWETLVISAMVLILTIILSGLCQAQAFGSLGQMQTRITLPWAEHSEQTISKEFGISVPFKWGKLEYRHTFVRNLLWTVPIEKETQILEVKTDKPFSQEVLWCSHRLEITAYYGSIRPSIGLLHCRAGVHLTGEDSEKKPFDSQLTDRTTMVLGGLSRQFGVSRDTAVILQGKVAGDGHGRCLAMDLSCVTGVGNATLRVGWLLRQINLRSLPMTILEQGPYAGVEVRW